MMLGQQRLFEIDQGPLGRDLRAGAAPPGGTGSLRTGLEVEVRASSRRRKTATAYWDSGRVVVLLPGHLRGSERTAMIEWLVARVLSRRGAQVADDDALRLRAAELADRYVPGAVPRTVRWVTNQHKRWGSCTAESGEIRISHHLQQAPGWVLDAVLVHELAHLVHPDHSADFYRLAERFPRHREAATFLEGYALGLGAPRAPSSPPRGSA